MKRATAILTGDLEWRADIPVCRTDDFLYEQLRKWRWLKNLQAQHDCPVLDSGDVFDQWKSPPWLEALALRNIPAQFHTVPGNHDLPGHNLKNLEKSSLNVLEAAGKAKILLQLHTVNNINIYPFPWGSELTAYPEPNKGQESHFNVAICHVMTYEGDCPYPGCEDTEAGRLLRKMKGYDLVLTGHNHKPFVVRSRDGRLLVNPGSLMRTTADQEDYQPRVYLWFAEENEVEAVFVPIESGVISRQHLEKKAERDKRMEAFIENLSGEYEISSQYEKNLEAFFLKNKVRTSVQQLVMEASQ